MSDLSSEDEKEVKALKEALHLNLAMCYLKLEEWKKAKASCDSALEFNETVKGTVCVCVRACVCGCVWVCVRLCVRAYDVLRMLYIFTIYIFRSTQTQLTKY